MCIHRIRTSWTCYHPIISQGRFGSLLRKESKVKRKIDIRTRCEAVGPEKRKVKL